MILASIVKAVVGLRPDIEAEEAGLDYTDHGEAGYHHDEPGAHVEEPIASMSAPASAAAAHSRS